MYEMYPDSWASDDARPADTASLPARRRTRREHRILPVVAEPPTAGVRRGADDSHR